MARRTADRFMRARILLAAFKARRAAAVMLFVVAVLAVAAAAIGPMFLQSADTSVFRSTARATSPGQTDLTFAANGGASQMSKLSSAARDADELSAGLLSKPLFTVDVGSHFFRGGQAFAADVLARSGACKHLDFIGGACPSRIDTVAISKRSAAASGLKIGSSLRVGTSISFKTTDVTVSGIYQQPSKFDNSYWKGENYFDYGSAAPPVVELDPFVTTFKTVLGTYPVGEPQLNVDLAWQTDATRSGTSVIKSTIGTIKSRLFSHFRLVASTGMTAVITSTRLDDHLMSTVVLAIVLQLILLSLLILYTLGRSTILGRRQESEFARRHGFPRSALLALAIGEPAVLIIAALPVGILVAWASLVLVAKTLFVAGTPAVIPGVALVAAVGACVAGVVAMIIASSEIWRWRSLSERQAKLASLSVDAFALALALTGLLSLAAHDSLSGDRATFLALLAPGLLALGASVIGLRVAAFVVQIVLRRTEGSTHVAWFLALRQIGRRSSVLRQVIPLTTATAVLLFSVGSFFLASSNRSLAARFDVGAARVVDVTPPPGFNLQGAVRRADPSGREAMAAAYYSSPTGELLALDTARLAAVGFWPSTLSHVSLAVLARELSPRVPLGVSFSGTELRLTIDNSLGTPPPIELGVSVFDETYQRDKTLYVGPIVTGLHSYTVDLKDLCTGSCRLTGLVPNWVNPYSTYARSVKLSLRGVAVSTKGQWHRVRFGAGQPGTWDAQPSTVHVQSSKSPCCAVTFEMPGKLLQSSGLLLSPVDLPRATPALVADGIETSKRTITLDLDGSPLTIRPLIVVPALPLIGKGGAIVDYTFARRAIATHRGDTTFQVWLSSSASPAIIQRLRADGVTIGASSRASARLSALDHGGIALAYTVALFVSPIAALLAIGTMMFLMVFERRRRQRDFASLSMAGVPERTLRHAVLLENVIVFAVALAVGAGIGYVSDVLALRSLPEFVSGTGGLPISHSVPMAPFLCALGGLALLLAGASTLATRFIARGARSHNDGGFSE